MVVAVRLRQYLDSQGASYDAVAHAPTNTSAGSARAAHVTGDRDRLGKVVKSVVVHHADGYILAVVPSTHRFEFDSLRDILGKSAC